MNYFIRVLVAVDQMANAVIGGMPDETISAALYRKNNKIGQKIINTIFRDSRHCEDSYYSELGMKHLPSVYRESKNG